MNHLFIKLDKVIVSKNKNVFKNVSKLIAKNGRDFTYGAKSGEMKMGKRIIVIGSINMDLVVSIDDFPKPGETILGKQHQWFPGGKGANQAIAILRAGGNVRMVGKIGDDNLGEMVLDNFRRENLDLRGVKSITGAMTGLAIINVNSLGENNIVVSAGANKIWEETEAEITDLLKGYDMVVLQQEIPLNIVKSVLRIAKGQGLYTILNSAPASQEILPSLKYVDLLIVNEVEVSVLSGAVCNDIPSITKAVTQLDGNCHNIIVTLGKDGCLVFVDNTFHGIPSYKVKAVDTTAAGDVFVGAVATRLSEEGGILDAARWATAASALTVTKLGAQASIPYRRDICKFIKECNK
jgi:ribokinase